MRADTYTPTDILSPDVRYLVPLFQRPYVWTRADQWEPLWDDVSTLAERILESGGNSFGGQPVPPHFLGAIVLEQQLLPVAHIPIRHVIDGQQRLTTLQILPDAAQGIGGKSKGDEGKGKRRLLAEHGTLKLNNRFVLDHVDAWTEEGIKRRTDELAARICHIWPRPAL